VVGSSRNFCGNCLRNRDGLTVGTNRTYSRSQERSKNLHRLSVLGLVAGLLAGPVEGQFIPNGVSLSGLVGTVTVDRDQWQRLNVRPRINVGSIRAAFDLELFMDEGGQIRDRGWDFSSRRAGLQSLLRKIHFLQYGMPEDPNRPVYFRVGALESLTLGNGLIVRDYRNTFGSPGNKRTGVDLQIRGFIWKGLKLRGFASDLVDLLDRGTPVVGGRVTTQAFVNVELGGTLVVDMDQHAALPDSVKPSETNPYAVYGADITLPIYQASGKRVAIYGGLARNAATTSRGYGLHGPGISFLSGRLSARVEGRYTHGRFEPDHFDAFYDQTRAIVEPSGRIVTREDGVRDVALRGVFARLAYERVRSFSFHLSYQHLTGSDLEDRMLWADVSVFPEMLKAIRWVSTSEFYYEKRARASSTVDFLDPDQDTRFGYRIGLQPARKVQVIWEVEFTYEPDAAGGFKRRRTFNLQTGFAL
jgi:hypothetical protein